jgi:transcriptional regulator with XRE-family HTH domain
MDSSRDLGSLLRALRDRSGLTQAELADALGVKRTTVTCWESSTATQRLPDLHTLRRLGEQLAATDTELRLAEDLLAQAQAARAAAAA